MVNSSNTSFDQKLWRDEDHYNRYPQLLPYISPQWDLLKGKILILGESHFQPDGCPERNDNDWYALNFSRLFEHEIRNTYTRQIVSESCFAGASSQHVFFNTLSRELSSYFSCSPEEAFRNISFCNYFQRPAATGKSLKPTSKDKEIAYRVLKHVTRVLSPTKIIFVSGNAAVCFYYNRSIDSDNSVFNHVKIDYTVHPCCSWWNRPLKRLGNRTGRQKFIDVLNYNA